MDIYLFEGGEYCSECVEPIKKRLELDGDKPSNPDDERSYDSCQWPKGPDDSDYHESDTPCHCENCGVFLGNQLTDEGVNYVLEILAIDGYLPQEWVDGLGVYDDRIAEAKGKVF